MQTPGKAIDRSRTAVNRRRQAGVARARRRMRSRVLLSVAAALVLAGGLIWIGNSNFGGGTSVAFATSGKVKGEPAAPVLIEVWSDFQCPACRLFVQGVGRQIEETLVAPGLARLMWRDMAFLGDESTWAAEAADCATDQGQFWGYHDKLYAEQAGENRGAFSKDRLKRFAGEIGLEQAAFNACFDSGKHAAWVQQEVTVGKTKGVRSTPTIFVNGQRIVGAASYEQIRLLVDQELGKPKVLGNDR